MKNKKAGINFLGEKTTDIVIAVLVIVMLVFLGAKIFGMFSEKSELTKAIDNVNNFAREYNTFIESGVKEKSFIILGPEDWLIAPYSTENDLATSAGCVDYKYCVCICKYDCNDELTACSNISAPINIEKGKAYEMNEIPYKITLINNKIEEVKTEDVN